MRQLLSYKFRDDIMPAAVRYSIGDLAALGGVSRRTVRYYVQEGLIPEPLGRGRGDHYGEAHLAQLLRVKAMQEAGRTLDEIRRALAGTPASRAFAQPLASTPALPSSMWRRIELAEGVELHVASSVRLSPGKLRELAAWCRTNFGEPDSRRREDEDEDA
jgi:DNA-binding transcriptional MerR regulator